MREQQLVYNYEEVEAKHLERYKMAADYCENKVVLDACCGCGYGSALLAEKATSVVGIDTCEEALDWANKYWAKGNVVYMNHDLNKDLAGKYDVIVCFEGIEHLETRMTATLKKFYDALNPGGVLLVSHPENAAPHPHHVWHRIKGRDFSDTVAKVGFTVEKELYQERPEPIAKRWILKYHVVIARKK